MGGAGGGDDTDVEAHDMTFWPQIYGYKLHDVQGPRLDLWIVNDKNLLIIGDFFVDSNGLVNKMNKNGEALLGWLA